MKKKCDAVDKNSLLKRAWMWPCTKCPHNASERHISEMPWGSYTWS